MPFKSKAQLKKFVSLVKTGKMSQETFDKWKNQTDFSKLPDRAQTKMKKGQAKIKVIK